MRRPDPLALVALVATGLVLALAACVDPSPELPAAALAAVPEGGSGVTPIQLDRPPRPATLGERLAANLHPSRDGWDTEVLTEQAAAQLDQLRRSFEAPAALAVAELAGLVAQGFAGSTLRPDALEEVYSQGALTVRRWKPGDDPAPTLHHGPEGLAAALRELARDGDALRLHLKIVRIDVDDAEVIGTEETGTVAGVAFSTTILAETSRRSTTGASPGSVLQQNATWRARWIRPNADSAPRLLALAVERYEEVELEAAEPLFSDVTAAALGELPAYGAQVVPGIDHWLERISLLAGMSIVAHHGLAVGDADGDGLEDLYVCDAAGLPNRLYLHQSDGTLRDASAEAGVDWLEASSSALLVDLDGDGDQDLAVATRRGMLISENDGAGRFTLRVDRKNLVPSTASLSAADFDLDGDLDLYLCAYDGDQDNTGLPGPVPYHDAENGGANVLLDNRGGFQFDDVTAEVGLDANNRRFSFAATWDDYDLDGDLDLYVANDFGRNNLYRNEGGRFADVAAETGAEDVASGMSAAWGDADRDGWPDLYVSNMFSSAGNRVAYQRAFAAGVDDAPVAELQRMARGNTLFLNRRGTAFEDRSEAAGVTMGRWAWASRFADLDNDGWLDLVVTNGYVTGAVKDDL